METIVFGISKDVKLLQPENTEFPMEVMEFGIPIDVKPLQL